MQVALITGVGGQDGFYLARLLRDKGYEVHGLLRHPERASEKLRALGVTLHRGDLQDRAGLLQLLDRVRPQELYNLAAQASVVHSWQEPEYTAEVDALGVIRLLEGIRHFNLRTRLFQASSMIMYGHTQPPFREHMHFQPESPYGISKLHAHLLCASYRAKYEMFVSCGILFHHESPLRNPQFVVRKITLAVANILAGKQDELHLGNLDAECDWSDARDIVRGMWQMLQADRPGDYILASGRTRTIRQVVAMAFQFAHLDWTKHVVSDSDFYRSSDLLRLEVEVEKARQELGFRTEIPFADTLYEMLEHDCELVGAQLPPRGCDHSGTE